jgi:rhodanese-related sulfurtransferase
MAVLRIGRALARTGAEICIIAVAAVLASAIFGHVSAFISGEPEVAEPTGPSPRIGSPVNLRDVQYSGEPLSIVLVVSPTCGYCRKSVPFYRSLSKVALKNSVPLYAVVPDVGKAGEFLRTAGLDRVPHRELSELGVNVSGTPTIFVVDEDGLIRRMWVGALSEQRSKDLLALVADPRAMQQLDAVLPSGEVNFRDNGLDRLENSDRVLDIRERTEFALGHKAGALNIPFGELYVRSRFELDTSALYVIDCSSVPEKRCRAAIEQLVGRGIRAAALNAGGVEESCRITLRTKPT